MTNLSTEEMQRIVDDLTPHPLAKNELRDAGVLDAMTEAKYVILAQQQEIERLRGFINEFISTQDRLYGDGMMTHIEMRRLSDKVKLK